MVLLVITDYSNSVRGSTEMMNNCLPFFLSAKMYTSIYLILFCLGSLSGYLGTVCHLLSIYNNLLLQSKTGTC